MAGSPKKRARREQAAREATPAPTPTPPRTPIPEAHPAPTHDAHPRARVGVGERRSPPGAAAHRVQLGPRTRDAVDTATSETLQSLGDLLRPGFTLRLERTRPAWCAGWVEDYELERGEGLRDVYAHVASDWGGQSYRVTVLGVGGQALYQSRLEVAGVPRADGRTIDRDEWEGRSSARAANPAPQTSPMGAGFESIAAFVKLFVDQQRATSDAQLGAVKEMMQRSNDTASRVLEALVQRDDNPRGGNFVEQLGQVLEAGKALDNVRRSFGAARATKDEKPDDDDVMGGAVKQAVGNFLSAALTKTMAPRSPQQPQVRAPNAAVRPASAARPSPIPEARPAPAGQPERKN